jgi:hypothetical protein
MVFLDKDRMTDNVQQRNICTYKCGLLKFTIKHWGKYQKASCVNYECVYQVALPTAYYNLPIQLTECFTHESC